MSAKAAVARIKEPKTKEQMTKLVEKAYKETGRVIQPMPPFIFIRTLPRSTITDSGLILPQKQNKPNIEAVVLAVYKPFWEKVQTSTREDGKTEDVSVYNECDLKVGDHIVFAHYVGMPDSFLDEREYRVIREDDAVATLQYREKDWLQKELYALVDSNIDREGEGTEKCVQAILEKYDLVPKDVAPKTLSGE